jgi:hypothetical protein
LADGTVPKLYVGTWHRRGREITDGGATNQLLSSLNSPLSVGTIELSLLADNMPTPEQLAKILEAMANLMVVVSEVGYEMAAAAHSGGEE